MGERRTIKNEKGKCCCGGPSRQEKGPIVGGWLLERGKRKECVSRKGKVKN